MYVVDVVVFAQMRYDRDMENELKTERFQLILPPSLREKIREWRFAHRISSESEAIRQLIEAGMEALEKQSAGK